MNITNNTKIPFINEAFTEQIKDLKIFIHNNIYSDNKAIEILKTIIGYFKDIETVNLEMDGQYKTIIISFNDRTNGSYYDGLISFILQSLFSDSYIQELLKQCENQYKYSLTDLDFLKLLFNITILPDNTIKVFL